MAEEALDQGGVLTQEDLADILQVDVRTVRRTIRQLQERGIRVQTRGLYHDIGPSISHKAWIVSLHLEYKTYSEIARTTRHSTTSIKRYIMDFARVVLCIQRGLSLAETAHIAGISERLAENTQDFTCATTDQNTRIKFLVRRGMDITEISHLTGRGKQVVKQHLEIIKSHHPELFETRQEPDKSPDTDAGCSPKTQ